MQQPLRFEETEVGGPPAPGWYSGTITTACWRSSSRNNRMVYLVVALDSVGAPYENISDYFVLDGVTPRGIACSRRRLVSVFHASGLRPRVGEEIQPGVLEGHRIEVKLAHEPWKGKIRLQITGYRSSVAFTGAGDAENGDELNALLVAGAMTPKGPSDEKP
jgi:hypothetical protein